MIFKALIVCAALAVANAGYLGAPAIGYAAAPAYGYASHAVATPAITAQQSNILRSFGNLGQVSTYSKAIDTPFSSVRKSDVRVSNDALAYGAGVHAAPLAYAPGNPGVGYAAPVTYAAPAVHAAPVAYAAPAVHAAPVAYAAPAVHAAPVTYAAPAVHAAPVAYAAPAIHAAPVVKTATTAVAGHGLLGVAYSAAPAVAHMTYSNGLGLSYAW